MKKKILSSLLAIMMLGQTAFARNLQDYVKDTYTANGYIVNDMFDYGAFMTAVYGSNNADHPSIIPAKVTTTVKLNGTADAYAAHPSTNVLNSQDPAKNAFDYKAELDMSKVRVAFTTLYNVTSFAINNDSTLSGADKTALLGQFKASKVTGSFQVNVAYDANLTLDPATVFALKQNGGAPTLFAEVSHDTSSNPATFVFNVTGNHTVEDLKTNLNTYLADLSMEVMNVTAALQDTDLSVTVSLTPASTILNDETDAPADYAKIEFTSDATTDPATAVVHVPSTTPTPTPAPVPPSGGGSSYIPPRAYTVVDDVKTEIDVTKEGSKYSVNVDDIADPVKEGYIFDGWYLDTGFTNPVEGTLNIKRTTYLYAKFVPVDESAPKGYTVIDGDKKQILVSATNGKYFITVDELDTPVKDGFAFDGWYLDPYFLSPANGTIEITEDTHLYAKLVSTSVPQGLIADHHIAYIYGYPDGEVKPNGLITREEVAAAFYRLLEPSYRATIETTEHKFPDVEADRWSNEEIATLANGGYIVGDENGNFNPAKPITRAEFVTLANKFEQLESIPETNYFSDITGHWAEEAILSATNGHHWITGYEDGTFRPDNKITRAEAMTIINHMLVRYCDISSDIAKQWPDLATTDWYYGDVIEATTEHDFERDPDGWHEHWIKPGASEEETEPTEDNTADETTENADELTDETVAENTESSGQTAETAEEAVDENASEENTDANSDDTADENAETSEDTTVTE